MNAAPTKSRLLHRALSSLAAIMAVSVIFGAKALENQQMKGGPKEIALSQDRGQDWATNHR